MPNRLAHETSPYLLQHAENPVDWHPWSDEALARAAKQNLPILLSIGYSACHWCHVMAHESFEDEATAEMMNQHFVNIKVDREERPDLDSIYMNAVQRMTGRGGWPMTVFLTPDGVPFYGGTYFPPEPRHGMPSFQQVLRGVSEAYRERREEVDRSAAELHHVLRESATLRPPPAPLDTGLLDQAYSSLRVQFDEQHGGFGGAPKFPQPMTLEFTLRQWRRTGDTEPLRMLEETLRSMAGGGIYDHIGGGFHRYSVDAAWLVPHFEKMLYDNALLARLYLLAYQATGDDFYREIVEETLGYIEREMLSPEGGFYSAQDADSEGVEGKFYVWDVAEIDDLLGAEDGELFRRYYNTSSGGNFEGSNILHTPRSGDEIAAEAGVTADRLRQVISRGRTLLYERRSKRVWPVRDDKVVTAWNAMMLRSFAEAARVLNRSDYADIAAANAGFLLGTMKPGGPLLRTYREGHAKIHGFLEDYALLVDALVSLYEATFEPRWAREATAVADEMLALFWDQEDEAFYDNAVDTEQLVVRPRDLYDNATPSGNSTATHALLRLGPLVGEPRYSRIAARVLEGLGGVAAQVPSAFGELLCALDRYLATPQEVAIIGDLHARDTQTLLDVLRATYLPNSLIAACDPAQHDAPEDIPLLVDRPAVDGQATAYVCQRFVCQQPVTDPADLAAALRPLA